MQRSTLSLLFPVILSAACAGGTTQPRAQTAVPAAEVSDPSRWSADPRLYHMLTGYPITQAQRDSLAVYAGHAGTLMNELLAEAAEDRFAPAVVRVNALYMLAQNRAVAHLGVFRSALDDEDRRVRATAAASMREFTERYPAEALQIARMALQDSAAEVQAQALPIIGERDVPLLRSYLAEVRDPELRRIAQDLVAVAEQRGAPLASDTATGVLRRVTPQGITITFTPRERWPSWGAALGSVRVEGPGLTSFSVDSVEAVADVVPLFISSEGTHAVYERNRRIVVRTLATGVERVVGPGIAPRVRPFTDEFIYLREAEGGRTDMRDRTRIQYHVMRAGFSDPAVREDLGTVGAVTSYGVFGNYSPARWMRVEDRGGYYYLNAENMEPFPLPDPFRTGEAIR